MMVAALLRQQFKPVDDAAHVLSQVVLLQPRSPSLLQILVEKY